MTNRLDIQLDRKEGTAEVLETSSRLYTRDASVALDVHGFDLAEVTADGDGKLPGEPVFQLVNPCGRVVAQAMLSAPEGEPTPGADGLYSLVAILSTNTVEMRREYFGQGAMAVKEFAAKVMHTTFANPIAVGLVPVWNFPGSEGDAPTELPSASEVIAELRRIIEDHSENDNNPHGVTAEQVGAYTKEAADEKFALKSEIGGIRTIAKQAEDAVRLAREALNAHTRRTDNPHGVTADQIGLGNVDNTRDSDKPISNAQRTYVDSSVRTAKESLEARFSQYYRKTEVDSRITNGVKVAMGRTFNLLDQGDLYTALGTIIELLGGTVNA